ncbi:hypothetical protein [Cellulomonas sp. ICMP 17802]|uniref:hypothetical protein n=1 Tax=Cellulomonas sp. ICMP 17802 TaxID=3239199 RepID=UPI00351ACAA8
MSSHTAAFARARSGLAAVVVTLAVAVSAAGCSTSSPGREAPTSSAVALGTPAPAPSETLLTEGADSSHSAVGQVADGFPTALVPVPDGAEVLVSSAEPVDGTDLTEISLNLRTAQDAAGLLAAVRAPLLAAGFTEGTPPAAEPGLAAQSTFSRGDGSELLVVGILDRADERTLTLGGRVRTPAP